jgi:hypothetical protein
MKEEAMFTTLLIKSLLLPLYTGETISEILSPVLINAERLKNYKREYSNWSVVPTKTQ